MSYNPSGTLSFFEVLAVSSALTLIGVEHARAANMERLTDKSFIDALTKTKQLAEKELGGGAIVRVILKWEDGECDPHHEAKTCPHSQLLVLTVNAPGDISPDIGLWRTSRRIGWKFVRWADDAQANSTNSLSFIATACEATPEVESGKVDPRAGGWWQEVAYKIDVGAGAPVIGKFPEQTYGRQCELY